MRTKRRPVGPALPALALLSLTLFLSLSGCGSGGAPKAATKADWQRAHGAAVAAVSTQLDFARKALDQGQRDAILAACNLLNDDVSAARPALPVPSPPVDAALSTALNAVAVGTADCLQGARAASVASINERAMAELTAARADMDAANRAIAGWR